MTYNRYNYLTVSIRVDKLQAAYASPQHGAPSIVIFYLYIRKHDKQLVHIPAYLEYNTYMRTLSPIRGSSVIKLY